MTAPIYDPEPFERRESRRARRRVWPWIMAGVFAALLCGGGVVVTVIGGTAATVSAVADEMAQESASRAADIKITTCETDQLADFSTVAVRYTIINSATEARTYLPQFDIVAADGTVIGSAIDATQELAPAATLKGRAYGTVSEKPDGKVKCVLKGA